MAAPQSREQPLCDAQSLSCLLDGELDRAEQQRVIDRLLQDPQAQTLWSTLNAVGDAIRSSEVACLHRAEFAQRVADALRDEPTVLAPLPGTRSRAVRRYVLPGVAVAAAAAVLTTVAVPLLGGRDAANESPLAQRAPVVASTAAPTAGPATAPVSAGRVARPMSPYLQAHREFAQGAVLPPSAPYLRTSTTVTVEEGRGGARWRRACSVARPRGTPRCFFWSACTR